MSENFMTERLTKDDGEKFRPTRYSLISKNDAIVKPYATYDLFFEITFKVIQKLGTYEDVGTPEELKKLKERQKGKWVEDIKDALCHKCSNCNEMYLFNVDLEIAQYNFCPNCGADMREVEGSLWDKAIKADDIKKDDEWMQDDKWDEIYKEAETFGDI